MPEQPDDLLPPSEDGSCHCGATVLSTDPEPCIFCGGYTKQQMDSMTEEY